MAGMRKRWMLSWGVPATLLGTSLVFACGSTEKSGRTTSEAGAGGGDAPTKGQLEPCGVEDLAQYCAKSSCPSSPQDVVPFCPNDDIRGTTRSATECDGTVVSVNFGLGRDDYYFDERGVLVGLKISSDVGHQCPDGTSAIVTEYGETCAAVGEPEDVCEGAPGCNQAEVCGTGGPVFRECPADLDSIYDMQCERGLHYEATGSSCDAGGTVVSVSNGVATVQYTFDASGQLVGTVASDDSPAHRCWGKPCEPYDDVEVLCSGEGGSPATDAGGAGGSGVGGASSDAGGAGGSP